MMKQRMERLNVDVVGFAFGLTASHSVIIRLPAHLAPACHRELDWVPELAIRLD